MNLTDNHSALPANSDKSVLRSSTPQKKKTFATHAAKEIPPVPHIVRVASITDLTNTLSEYLSPSDLKFDQDAFHRRIDKHL